MLHGAWMTGAYEDAVALAEPFSAQLMSVQ